MSGGRIFIYAQDGGGARAIAPVVRSLLEKYPEGVSVITHLFAEEIFGKYEFPVENLSKIAGKVPLTLPAARRVLEEISPSAVFCTTSNNDQDPSNGEIIRASASLGIPCFAMMDHWKGWPRFHDVDGDWSYLPDVLGVIDERALTRGLQEGISPERMEIVGHPHLEALAAGGPADRKELREKLGIEDGNVFVCTLFTQPMRGGNGLRPLLEGERLKAVEKILGTLKDRMDRRGREALIFVRPHPREMALFGDIYESLPFGRLETETASLELAKASELVLGLDSMILYEAYCCGRPVLSLRLGASAGFSDEPEDGPELWPVANSPFEFEGFMEEFDDEGAIPGAGRAAHAIPTGAVVACERILQRLCGGNSLFSKELRGAAK
jgi:hypothetical protein